MVEQMETNTDEEIDNESEEKQEPKKKKGKRGIIYLASIPLYMNVTRIREVFEEYGIVCRIYLQLDPIVSKPGEKPKKHKQVSKKFVEGWVEFERKSTAKKVALLLNNKRVSNRKSSKNYDCIWNIKYLPRFKWPHLHERLAYEKATRRQKLQAEIQLAKSQTNYFSSNVDKKKKKAKLKTNKVD